MNTIESDLHDKPEIAAENTPGIKMVDIKMVDTKVVNDNLNDTLINIPYRICENFIYRYIL